MSLMAFISLSAQTAGTSISYDKFMAQRGIEAHKGYFSVYNVEDKYYLAIPQKSLGKDVLVNVYASRGKSAYVSPQSGIMRAELTDDGQQLAVMLDRTVEVDADSSDSSLRAMIEQSSLRPIDYILPVTCRGNGMVIVELTSELSNPNGLFDVSDNTQLSHPDPDRSGIDGITMIDKGVIFHLTRTQTDTQSNPDTGNSRNYSTTIGLEILIQQLPDDEDMSVVKASPLYGFDTVNGTEYSSSKYVARAVKYITRWRLGSGRHITVSLDKATPAPFRESIRRAVKQWEDAFARIGRKDVFRITTDEASAHLAYGTMMFCWNVAFGGITTRTICNRRTGEILAARANMMDVSFADNIDAYFLQCGDIDQRIRRDITSIGVRQDLLTSLAAAAIGKMLGMKDNKAALTALPLSSLHDKASRLGPTASVTAGMAFNYVARPADVISVEYLMPHVSTYDTSAIAYAYGGKSGEATFGGDDPLDPYVQPSALSSDIYSASLQGISNIKDVYSRIDDICKDLPQDENNWKRKTGLGVHCLALWQGYLQNLVNLVGGRSVRNGATTYVPKATQQKALDYLSRNIFTDQMPQWVLSPVMMEHGTYDLQQMTIGLCQSLLTHFQNKEVYRQLWHAEALQGNKAFTGSELISWIEKVIYKDFSATTSVPLYKRSLQAIFASDLAQAQAQANIANGITNEGNNMLHAFMLRLYERAQYLVEHHADAAMRSSYKMIVMRMNREYFDKSL